MLYTSKYAVSGPGLDNFSFPAGEVALVVGDSHGQNEALQGLLDLMGRFVTPGKKRHLVFLGDHIDRGPDSLGCLNTVFSEAGERAQADVVTYLPGNHELMLVDTLDAMNEGDEALKKSPHAANWLLNGGLAFMNEAFETNGKIMPKDMVEATKQFAAMLPTAGHDSFDALVKTWPSHVRIGDLLCVHAGISPKKSAEATLNLSQQSHKHAADHWAWVREPFLAWQRGWDDGTGAGSLIFHGHTVPSKLRPGKLQHGEDVRDVFCRMETNARVCLDGGAAKNVGVAGAVLGADGMRVLFNAT